MRQRYRWFIIFVWTIILICLTFVGTLLIWWAQEIQLCSIIKCRVQNLILRCNDELTQICCGESELVEIHFRKLNRPLACLVSRISIDLVSSQLIRRFEPCRAFNREVTDQSEVASVDCHRLHELFDSQVVNLFRCWWSCELAINAKVLFVPCLNTLSDWKLNCRIERSNGNIDRCWWWSTSLLFQNTIRKFTRKLVKIWVWTLCRRILAEVKIYGF